MHPLEIINHTFYVIGGGLLLLKLDTAILAKFVMLIVIIYIMKFIANKERPNKRDNMSFPSGHSAIAWYIAAVAYNFNPLIVLWAILVSYARVYAYEHWPLDVIAGAILGISIRYLN